MKTGWDIQQAVTRMMNSTMEMPSVVGMAPGRSCPAHYRYAPGYLSGLQSTEADCLYVIGGLYGNRLALQRVKALAEQDTLSPRLCFNGDFNWFNVDPAEFESIQQTVLQHDAVRGNVETEIAAATTAEDCGCGYPEWVDDDTVARSNEIIRCLQRTARDYPDWQRQLAALPMARAYMIGGRRVLALHGDVQSLAGWSLAREHIVDYASSGALNQHITEVQASVMACTHTCVAYLLQFGGSAVVNNGAAGMPNFNASHFGVITRIATTPVPAALQPDRLYGIRLSDARGQTMLGAEAPGGGTTPPLYIDALALHYDQQRWLTLFQQQWQPQSPAWLSYWQRLQGKLDYTTADALLRG